MWPGQTLGMLSRLLVTGGALCIRTRFVPRARADFPAWSYRTDPTHIGFFSVQSALTLANRCGLLPVRIEQPDRIVLLKP